MIEYDEDLESRKEYWGDGDFYTTWPRMLRGARRFWFVGANLVSRLGARTYAQIIVPAEDVNEMSAEEIGLHVKRLAKDAFALRAVSLAHDIIDHRKQLFKDYRQHWNYAAAVRRYILPYAKNPEVDSRGLIAQAVKIVDDLEKHVDKKEAGRQTKKYERAVAKRDLDALFVKIGRRDGFKCAACGSVDNLQLDHIEPVTLGGLTIPENLQLLCKPCNLRKGEQTIDYRGTEQAGEIQ